jgi:toxin FitB
MSHLIDPNILSELIRPAPNAGVLGWVKGQTRFQLSAITLEELYYGLSWKPNARVSAWLERFLKNHATVLPITPHIAEDAGILRGSLQRQGKTRT